MANKRQLSSMIRLLESLSGKKIILKEVSGGTSIYHIKIDLLPISADAKKIIKCYVDAMLKTPDNPFIMDALNRMIKTGNFSRLGIKEEEITEEQKEKWKEMFNNYKAALRTFMEERRRIINDLIEST